MIQGGTIKQYMQWDGNPLILGWGLVAEDKPSEFSCTHAYSIELVDLLAKGGDTVLSAGILGGRGLPEAR